jgi:predicted AlkP superfamily pyrophosphatase or phosphodiesterase
MVFLVASGGMAREAPAQQPAVEHVVLVGVDGLSPEGIRRAGTPRLDELMASGSWTLHARGVIPTMSSPNWASMLSGAGPDQHGVTSNDWQPDRHDVPPVTTGVDRIFPTIVGELHRARADAVIAVFHDWGGFGRLIERGAATIVEHDDGPVLTMQRARAFLKERPTLLVVHLDHVDHAGHEHGWLSAQYLTAVREADRLVGELVAALRAENMWARTALIVSADHGGVGAKHGGVSLSELEIPWIAGGAGIARGGELEVPVSTTDTAPTMARLLGITSHAAWTGRPVLEALAPR